MGGKDKSEAMPSFNKLFRLEKVKKELFKQTRPRDEERRDKKKDKNEKLDLSLDNEDKIKAFINTYDNLIVK